MNSGPVTLVGAAGNMQLVFTFLFAVFFTRFLPQILKEKFDRKITAQKISGMLLIIIGVLLTQLF
jgi:drug/metabolite transporter (DMT)-like permease